MTQSPQTIYDTHLASGEYTADPEQQRAVLALDQIQQNLLAVNNTSCLRKFSRVFKQKNPITGLYLWGSVGIGKTWLMDMFVASLPAEIILRMHFHRFMRMVHQQLQAIKGVKNPLKKIAKEMAKTTRVICFDEFFVSDITNAMLLAGLFSALFAEGITLVATSNVEPDDLYKNGLQRERFLPAIELIKQNCQVMHLQSQHDYRLRELHHVGVYYFPLDANASAHMQHRFDTLAGQQKETHKNILIGDREIQTVGVSSGIVWFDFSILCTVPRSQLDYLDIARSFHTLLLSNVSKITRQQDNQILYLINLIDILYDSNVNLIMSAEAPINELYTEGRYRKEFERTKSRMIEMQSLEYLQRPHIY